MDVTFGGVSARPGTKVYGGVPVTHTVGASSIQIPVAIVNGSQPGPRVWVLAGVHGDEIEGIVATQRVVRDIDPEGLRGSLIAVLAANPSAVSHVMRESAIDRKDLNRAFPGDENGTFTDRLAHVLFSSMLAELTEQDAIVSLHGGGRSVVAASLIEIRGTGDDKERQSLELARVACNPHLRYIARVEERTGPWASVYRGTFSRELDARISVPSITIEAGGMGMLAPEDIGAHYEGILNVMRARGMLDGNLVPPSEEIIVTQENIRVFPKAAGFWLSHVKVRDRVTQGSLIAEVVDIYGHVQEELRSPFDGIVLYLRAHGVIDPQSGSLGDQYGCNIARYP